MKEKLSKILDYLSAISFIVAFCLAFWYGIPVLTAYGQTIGTWTLSATGTITSLTDSTENFGSYFREFLTPQDTGTYNSGITCTGANSQSNAGGNWPANRPNLIGFNVYNDGGLNQTNCTDTGYYYLGVWSPNTTKTTYQVRYQLYWNGTTAEVINYDSSTRIINVNEPEIIGSVVTASTTVNFNIDYASSYPIPETICIEIDNLTAFQTLIPLCETINSSGVFQMATSTILIDGNQYRWGVVIRDENGSIIDERSPYFFTVLTPPYTPYEPGTGGEFGPTPAGTSSTSTLSALTLECDPNEGFFYRSVCNLGVLLFVPSQNSVNQLLLSLDGLTKKQPFSAFNEFREGWNEATKNPNIAYSSVSLNLYGEDIDVVSTTTLNGVLGDNGTTLNFFKGLLTIGLWIFLGWFLFNRVVRLF